MRAKRFLYVMSSFVGADLQTKPSDGVLAESADHWDPYRNSGDLGSMPFPDAQQTGDARYQLAAALEMSLDLAKGHVENVESIADGDLAIEFWEGYIGAWEELLTEITEGPSMEEVSSCLLSLLIVIDKTPPCVQDHASSSTGARPNHLLHTQTRTVIPLASKRASGATCSAIRVDSSTRNRRKPQGLHSRNAGSQGCDRKLEG